MENFFEQLNNIIAISGKCVNLGRNLSSKHSKIYDWILTETNFLDHRNPSFNERVWCVINNKTSIVLNEFGAPAKFKNLFKGYSLCSSDYKSAISVAKKQAEKKSRMIAREEKKPLTKLEKFIKRNLNSNKNLYLSSSIENIDYVQCPVSGARLRLIRRDYIEKVLGIKYEDYRNQFPDQKMVCEGRVQAIVDGLKRIDTETGLSLHAIGVNKAVKTLRLIDPKEGITGYQKKGQKTRETHMSNVDEFGRNGYSRIATRAIVKGNITKVEKGLISATDQRDEFHRYKCIVIYLTNILKPALLKNSGKKIALSGTKNAYQIDHIFSKFDGWKYNVSPLVIGDINNLQIITWEENLRKHSRSDVDLKTLLEKCGYTEKSNKIEFDSLLRLIKQDIDNDVPANGAYILEKYRATFF
jgi:molybdopterin-binding protein